MDMLKSVHIEGFKSIRDATIDLGPLTVLIGANGSGKSNLVSFFRLMQVLPADLQKFVARAGGAESLLRFGVAHTDRIRGRFEFTFPKVARSVGLIIELIPMDPDGLFISGEKIVHPWTEEHMTASDPVQHGPGPPDWLDVSDSKAGSDAVGEVYRFLFAQAWQAYHFHDTSQTSGIRQSHYIEDNKRLHHDASNLAPYLYMLREVERPYYDRIIGAFRMAARWFDDFVLEPRELDPNSILLNWREKGHDRILGPHQLSDGSLRTIALFTLLLQPEERLPSLVIIDEPELGLHPYAITMLGSLLRSASKSSQVIVATQSVTLLEHFTPEEIVVAERDREGGTVFKRQSEDELAEWLEHYSMGELWLKNVIGGRP